MRERPGMAWGDGECPVDVVHRRFPLSLPGMRLAKSLFLDDESSVQMRIMLANPGLNLVAAVTDDYCVNARDDGSHDIGAVEYDGDGPCGPARELAAVVDQFPWRSRPRWRRAVSLAG